MNIQNKYIFFVLSSIASITFASLLIRYSEVGPIASGGYRLILTIPALFFISRLKSPQKPIQLTQKTFLYAVMSGICFALDLAFYNIAILKTTLAEATLLTNLVPFIIAPISIIFFKERLPLKFLIAVIFAISGMLCLNFTHGITAQHLTGNYLALLTAIFYTLFLIFIKKASQNYPINQAMLISCLSGGILLFVIAYYIHQEVIFPSSSYGVCILCGIAFFGQLSGQTLLSYSIKFLPLQLASLFLLFSPIFAAFYAYLFQDEKLVATQLFGVVIIMGAVYYGKKILAASLNQKSF